LREKNNLITSANKTLNQKAHVQLKTTTATTTTKNKKQEDLKLKRKETTRSSRPFYSCVLGDQTFEWQRD